MSSCIDCMHFVEFEDDPKRGMCVRYPPSTKVDTCTPIHIPATDTYKYETSAWETVVMRFWNCGEFKQKLHGGN